MIHQFQSILITYFIKLIFLIFFFMWNLKDRNKLIATQDKVNAFKKHLQAMYQIKPSIKINQPWRPSFSLSKFNNKYHKFGTMEILRQNSNLIGHLTEISNEDKYSTFLEIPRTAPSNKETFKCFKKRERNRQQASVDTKNSKILSKIKSINSIYSKNNYLNEWKKTVQYKANITKKQFNPDFYILAKQSLVSENPHSRMSWGSNSRSSVNLRPKTALPR